MSDQQTPDQRVGNADRDAASRVLAEHYQAGRLTEQELHERSAGAAAARTRADLEALFRDLPQPGAPGADPGVPPYLAGAPAAGTPPYVAGPPPGGYPVQDASSTRATSAQPSETMSRMLAISGGLVTVVFLVLGFAFHAWPWAWVVFLVPGLVRGYYGLDRKDGPGPR
jgi:hypothetical protein